MTEFTIWHYTKEKLPPKNVDVLIKYLDYDKTEIVSIGYKENDHAESDYWFDKSLRDWDGCVDSIFAVFAWAELPIGPKLL